MVSWLRGVMPPWLLGIVISFEVCLTFLALFDPFIFRTTVEGVTREVTAGDFGCGWKKGLSARPDLFIA